MTKPVLTKPRGDVHAFPAKVCAMLAQIRAKRQNAQNEERSMVKRRKDLDQWFQSNGDPGEVCAKKKATPEVLRLHADRRELFHLQSAEYKRTLDAIKASRVVQAWLAEKADALIDMGMEGRISDDLLDDAIDELTRQAPEMPLFSIAAESAKAEKGAARPGSEHVDRHDGTTAEIDASVPIMEMTLAPKTKNRLRDMGLSTIRDVAAYLCDYGEDSLGRCVKDKAELSRLVDCAKPIIGQIMLGDDPPNPQGRPESEPDPDYRKRPVEHLAAIERHGVQIVPDGAIRCLKNAEIERIGQIGKLSGVYGLSVTDCEAITQAIEILQNQKAAPAAA
jgi:hypothetical protein